MTKDEFNAAVKDIQAMPGYKQPDIFGLLVNGENGHFMHINANENFGSAAVLMKVTGALDEPTDASEMIVDFTDEHIEAALAYFGWCGDELAKHPNVQALLAMQAVPKIKRPPYSLVCVFDKAARVTSRAAALAKLTAVARGKLVSAQAYTLGMDAVMQEVYWTSSGAIHPDDLMTMKARGIMHQGDFHKLPPYLRGGSAEVMIEMAQKQAQQEAEEAKAVADKLRVERVAAAKVVVEKQPEAA